MCCLLCWADVGNMAVLQTFVPTLLSLARKYGTPAGEQPQPSYQRISVACQALDLLNTVIRLDRSLIEQFISFAEIRSLITDLLVVSHSARVRDIFKSFCNNLCFVYRGNEPVPDSRVVDFFLDVLINARLPLWHIGGPGRHRGHLSTLPAKSQQYFNLLSRCVLCCVRVWGHEHMTAALHVRVNFVVVVFFLFFFFLTYLLILFKFFSTSNWFHDERWQI